MSRSDHSGTNPSSNLPRPDETPELIVVQQHSGGLSPLLIPPFLLVTIAVGFFGYRAAQTDWRGFSGIEFASLWSKPSPTGLIDSAKTEPAPMPAKQPAPIADEKPTPALEPEQLAADTSAVPSEPVIVSKTEAETINELRLESERKKEQKDEMERLKQAEREKLDATKDERLRAARAHDANERLRRRLPRIEKQHEAFVREFENQFKEMERLMRRQQEEFRRWGVEQRRSASRQPGVPGPNGFMGLPWNEMGELQEFRGPNGSHVFVFKRQFRFGGQGIQVDPSPDEIPEPPNPPRIPDGR